MDIRSYIESGAIEAYVLGLATAAEAAELEQLRKQYPEVDNAIVAFEEQLERTAIAEVETPPAFVKEKLTEKLFIAAETKQNGKLVAMDQKMVKPVWKYIAAASIILLAVSTALNVYFHDMYKSADRAYQQLSVQQNSLQASNEIMNTKLNDMNESMKIMTDPAVRAVTMSDAQNKQGSNFRATVYWDTKTKDVYLLSNNLPKAPAGKQYQLWAIVDGKPVDAGMMDECTGICHMKNIPQAQMFAITLEEKGGKPQPEGEMYVLGKI